MLALHTPLIISLFSLKLPKMLFSLLQFRVQLMDPLFIIVFFAQVGKCLFLIFLNFDQGSILILKLLQDSLLIFPFVLKLSNLLDIVRLLKLMSHLIDFILVKLSFGSRFLKFCFLFFDKGVRRVDTVCLQRSRGY